VQRRLAPLAGAARVSLAGAFLSLLSLLSVCAFVAPAAASPMQDAAKQLACEDETAAAAALEALQRAPIAPFGLPEESLAGADDELDSVAYDNLLDALATARQRFPGLASRIDALVARWNFCELTADGERWDLSLAPALPATSVPRVVRRRAPRISPLLGAGFAAWDLLPRRAGGRPRFREGVSTAPPAGSTSDAPQCQARSSLQLTPLGPLPAIPDEQLEPDAECAPPPPPVAVAAAPAAAAAHGASPTNKKPGLASAAGDGDGDDDDGVLEVDSPTTRDAAAPPPGTFSTQLVVSATGNVNTGASLSLAPPIKRTFARVGLSWRWITDWEEAADLEPSWSWGIGYDDWRPGTFSLQLNHWGPLRRFRKAALEGAVLSAGYKIPLPKRPARYLSMRAELSTPLTWSPSAGAGVSFKLPRSFFLSLGLSQKLLEQTRPTWTYVVGRSKWKAQTLAIILANYGPTKVGELNLRGLALTLSWSWSL
jgi:hypothetical protein